MKLFQESHMNCKSFIELIYEEADLVIFQTNLITDFIHLIVSRYSEIFAIETEGLYSCLSVCTF